MNIPDNYDLWEQHEAEKEKALADCYHCDYCGQPIQEDYHYEINGDFLCKKCLDYHFRKDD